MVGVRYLQGVFSLDPRANRKQYYELVKEASEERENLVNNAPHLTRYLPTVIPCKGLFSALYYYIGMKIYTGISPVNSHHMFGCPKPYLMGQDELRATFPLINLQYKWGVVYHDGEMDDSRVNIETLLTATQDNYVEGFKGANILNYTKLTRILKNEEGTIIGAIVRDKVTNTDIKVKCKAIINATGCGADIVRRMDDPLAKTRIVHSRGSHLVLEKSFCPRQYGVLIPETSDGRVLFLLPWLQGTLVGTTDSRVKDYVQHPYPEVSDVSLIKKEIEEFYPILREKNSDRFIQSNWAGLRPLVLDDAAQNDPSIMTKSGELKENINTSKLSRLHVLESSASGLISMMGGKWTIYRRMGEDAVNAALDHIAETNQNTTPELANIENLKEKTTYYLPLFGDYRKREVAKHDFDEKIDHTIYHKTLVNQLENKRVVEDLDYLNYLSRTYGRRSFDILNMIAQNRELKERVHPSHSLTRAEVLYFTRYEQVVSPLDLLLRRSRMGFLDSLSAEECLPTVVDIIGDEYEWDDARKKSEYQSNLEIF